MKKNKYTTLLSNTAVFAVGNILVKVISFILMPLYTSVLTTEQYGVSELLNSTIEMILPLATFCIIEALYRFSIDEDANHQELFADSIKVIIIGDFIVAVCCIAASVIFKYQYAYNFLALYIATTFYKMTTQFARGLGHVKRYAFYGVLNSLVLIISNIILLILFHGEVAAYLASFSISYGISGIIAFILSKEYIFVSFKHRSSKKLREMLRYSLPNIPNMMSWWINSVSDRYIILFFWGTGMSGLYTAASKLPAMVNLVSSIFQQAWQYSTATEIEAEDQKPFFSYVLRGYVYICTITCAILIITNKIICAILLKDEFYSAWRFVPLLLLAATFGCVSTYFGTFYQALKNNMMLMVSTVIGACVNIGLNFILIPFYAGIGAAIATVVSYFVVMTTRVIDIRKKIELEINWLKTVLQILPLILLTVQSTFIQSKFNFLFSLGLMSIIILSDYGFIIEIFTKIKVAKKT